MLLRIPALLTRDEVRACRQAMEQAEWQDGRATAGHLAAGVKANLQLPIDSPLAAQLGDLILDKLGASPLFMAAALPLKVLPPRFNRYEGGGTYGNHIDNAFFTIPGTAIKVRTDVSTTVFFSDPDEYEGGELVVEDTFGTQQVKLAAGDLIVYPGTSLHRVNPVTRGTRYGSFFWTHSLVASAEQRRLLFDLDQQIQQLTARHPGDPALAALSGTYHNLLRMWSQA
jgi:PKHD-type hydroxylase